MTDKLTEQEAAAAALFGLTHEQFRGYSQRQPDVDKLEKAPTDAAERERVRAHVRDVLDERDREAAA